MNLPIRIKSYDLKGALMSMLSRYRKQGGFFQLLTLIETCEPAKQSKLIELVGNEDPGWAVLVKNKTLSLAKLVKWNTESLMEVTHMIPEKILSTVIFSQATDIQEKFINSLPPSKSREVKSLLTYIKPTTGEQNAAIIKMIQIIRELDKTGKINLTKIDPTLALDPKIAA